MFHYERYGFHILGIFWAKAIGSCFFFPVALSLYFDFAKGVKENRLECIFFWTVEAFGRRCIIIKSIL